MKYQRQAKILELVEKYDIETQDDLLEKLKEEGFQATQATRFQRYSGNESDKGIRTGSQTEICRREEQSL